MTKYEFKVDPETVKNFLNRIYGDPSHCCESYTTFIDYIINDIKEKEKMKNTILIKQIDEKTVVAAYYEAGDPCGHRYINPTLMAEAKCAPEDKFDFQTGAELAFERLMKKIEESKKPKPTKLVGSLFGIFYGDIGELSPYHDKNGIYLHVGDVVYIPDTDKVTGGYRYVAKDANGEFFIFGAKNYSYSKYGKLDSAIQAIIEKKKSYKDISIGETYCGAFAQ